MKAPTIKILKYEVRVRKYNERFHTFIYDDNEDSSLTMHQHEMKRKKISYQITEVEIYRFTDHIFDKEGNETIKVHTYDKEKGQYNIEERKIL